MAFDRIDPSEQVPEADLLEQEAPLEPPVTDEDRGAEDLAISVEPVDEADRWEQQLPVPAAEDEYPHEFAAAR